MSEPGEDRWAEVRERLMREAEAAGPPPPNTLYGFPVVITDKLPRMGPYVLGRFPEDWEGAKDA